jgi:hypothetical protein
MHFFGSLVFQSVNWPDRLVAGGYVFTFRQAICITKDRDCLFGLSEKSCAFYLCSGLG